MGKLRFFLALWAAKLSGPILKLTKHRGTNFPGELALRICPDFLRYVGKPGKIFAVTGTNGKTTVSNLVSDLLSRSGLRVLNNRAGSNINSGIATCLTHGVNIFNHSRFDVAVLEVDEIWSRFIFPYVRPDLLVITNLFRDSIKRNAHPQYIADILTESIPADTKLILNADDLISSQVAPGNMRVCFGIGPLPTDTTECRGRLNDARICPKCAGRLRYEYVHYHHIGRAHCDRCGFHSPVRDYLGTDVDLKARTMKIEDSSGSFEYALLSDNIVNAYNLLTAVALCREAGFSHAELQRLLDGVKLAESRYMERTVKGVRLVLQMAKAMNPPACSRAFDYVSRQDGEKEVLLMMNCMSDEENWSENVSWLYDCDFEYLNDSAIVHIVAAGPRAEDYRLRLLLAGIPDERIEVVPDRLEAAEHLHLSPGSSAYILYGAYAVDLASRLLDRTAQLVEERTRENEN